MLEAASKVRRIMEKAGVKKKNQVLARLNKMYVFIYRFGLDG